MHRDTTAPDMETLTVRIQEGLEGLHSFTSTPGHGTTRLPFSPEARGAAEYLKTYMAGAGLTVHEDPAGNILGLLPGEDPSLPALVTGSHFDTVMNGGNFDGQSGIVAGVEVARLLQLHRVPLKRNFLVIAFMDEEGMRFSTGYFGSKAWLGQLSVEDLHGFLDKDGISVYAAMKEYGLVPEELPAAKWDLEKVKAFIEVHIEQGPVLDTEKTELGLVECIVGIQRYMVTVFGRADHAGTTPMNMRMDALEAAAKVIGQIPGWARQMDGGMVATTGFLQVLPGGINIVPEEVQFSIDLRSRSRENLNAMMGQIRSGLEAACRENGTRYQIEEKLMIAPLHLSEPMLNTLEKNCQKRGYSYRRMASGAGHDSLAIGQMVDTVMVFTPSRDGRSHCPVEWTDYADIAKAASVVYDLILEMQE